MKREPILLGLSVLASTSIMAWIVWSERPVPVAIPTESTVSAEPTSAPTPTLDPARVAVLKAAIAEDPEDRDSRVELATTFFRAHEFEEAVPWFEQAIEMDAADVESSTHLGVSYFYAGFVDEAVEQLDRSLQVDPDHAQTWLSIGIVRAFGLDDLDGAVEAWERVIEVAPDGPEARAAREALTRVPAELGVASSGTTSPEQP